MKKQLRFKTVGIFTRFAMAYTMLINFFRVLMFGEVVINFNTVDND